ncbi:N-acetyltransferase [Aquisalinus flavus]|uniref:N-acetyltransferase n=1 Tax=Aquisalinus flavus TaxID=1526572 RepID=A0A8J2V5T9_9PROT|nr:GNAT family N-acetyltransferase [Aquisalinus flavus]GGD06125.1 N-acetyltransferase [Aquisalinus flavus]
MGRFVRQNDARDFVSGTGQDFSIRQARPEDADTLAALGARTFDETFGHLYAAENLESFQRENHDRQVYDRLLTSDDCHVLIAEAPDGTMAAYAVAGPCGLPVDEPGPNDIEIKRLYVDRPFQNSGLGRALLEPLLEWCEAREPSGLYLSVYAHNHGAQRLYRRYGFDKVKEYEFLVGEHRDPEFIFRKQ